MNFNLQYSMDNWADGYAKTSRSRTACKNLVFLWATKSSNLLLLDKDRLPEVDVDSTPVVQEQMNLKLW